MTTCTESSMNFSYALTGLNAEVGEINDKVAKAIRKEVLTIRENEVVGISDKMAFAEFDNGIKKEIGDVLWFVALMCEAMGWSMEEVAQLNLDKLADRAKRNVIIGDGDNR